jgi:hypothetical protein
MPDLRDGLRQTIKTLNSEVWEHRVKGPDVDAWLSGFTGGDDETLHALFLLSQMTYFGDREIREALRAIFRDLYRYPIVESIRRDNGDTTDEQVIERLVWDELTRTRFLGVGNPSESGTHLLYYFRQENRLPADVFIHTHQIFARVATTVPGPPAQQLRDRNIRRYVFLDDLCGSGTQAIEYSRDLVEAAKAFDATLHFSYHPIIGSRTGLDYVRANSAFDVVEAVFEIDETFQCFGQASRHFADPPLEISKDTARAIAESYGRRLEPAIPLGYADNQLLLAFHHNTPDNTLPIMWSDTNGWSPVFRRYPKMHWVTP